MKTLSRFATIALAAALAAVISLLLPTAGRAAHARNGPTASRAVRNEKSGILVAARHAASAPDGARTDTTITAGARPPDTNRPAANAGTPDRPQAGRHGRPDAGESRSTKLPDGTARDAPRIAQHTPPMRC